MLGPNTHSHIEAQLKLTLWKVGTFVGVMQETSKHDPISKPHFMFSISGKWSLPGGHNVRAEKLKIFDVLDIFSI